MKRISKIAFITIHNPYNRISRSGVPYSIYQELQKNYEVIWIKPDYDLVGAKLLYLLVSGFKRILHICGYNVLHLPILSYLLSKSAEKKLRKIEYDCIFTLGSIEIAYLNADKPIFCRADAIVHSFPNYYVNNVPKFAKRWAYTVEERALHKLTLFFVASQWVIDEISKYKIKEPLHKFVLIETGANLNINEVQYVLHDYGVQKQLQILFVGYDIERKGINEAFDAVRLLNEKYQIKSILVVMGGKPSDELLSSGYVRYAGNKDKNNPQEYKEFYEEFAKASLFLFPTKAECHGIVNCEAAAYGLPIFSYNTGGVPSYCIDGVNGRCLPVSATGKDFAKVIYESIESGSIKRFSENSRKLFLECFNWETWGKKVNKYIDDCLQNLT